MFRKLPALFFLVLGACGLTRCAPDPISRADSAKLYATPLAPAERPLSVYFIGHSLVGRDMPALLAQLAGEGHRYDSQLGWGAELQAHWEPDVEIAGGEIENNHPRYREAHEAMQSGDYDVLVVTEKVSIRDATRYHDSWYYLSLWAEQAAASNPDIRVYLYETWHRLDVEEGWLERIDGDLSRYWEGEIIDRVMATGRVDRPVYVIPGGQVLAAFVREIEARGGVGGLSTREDLFVDEIHFNDIGAYLMALTHYAVMYGISPAGLPHEGFVNAKGAPMTAPSSEAAELMQDVVWSMVTGYPRTGVQAR